MFYFDLKNTLLASDLFSSDYGGCRCTEPAQSTKKPFLPNFKSEPWVVELANFPGASVYYFPL